ncbi:hypothetical protein GCK32_020475, partial [Trichostrongylus colubriformis]
MLLLSKQYCRILNVGWFEIRLACADRYLSRRRSPSGEQVNALLELTVENERLRKELLESTTNLDRLQNRLNEVDADMTRVTREGKMQALKTRAVAQGR